MNSAMLENEFGKEAGMAQEGFSAEIPSCKIDIV